MPLIVIKNLSFSYKDKAVLTNISFSLKKGEKLVILAPNGGGKTTFLKLCGALLKLQKGQIFLHENPLQNYKPKQRAQFIAYLGQTEKVASLLSAREIVSLGRMPYRSMFFHNNKQDQRLVNSCLKKVGMIEFQNHKWYQLSGGQQQRVLLARALAQTPDLLILDEPTNHLDIHQQFRLLSFLKASPLGIIMSLHDLNLAANFADKLLLLKNGQIHAFGSPQAVLTQKNIEEIFQIHCSIDIIDPIKPDINIRFFEKKEQHP